MWRRVAAFKNKHWLNRQQQQQRAASAQGAEPTGWDPGRAPRLAREVQAPFRSTYTKLYEVSLFRLTKAKTADHWPGRGIPGPGQHTHLEPSNPSRA
ncbi:hypothetical protein QR685DRAFT_574786 [Neurospora intermedia]|uniref:Uncharacterized protein n=1 Tax=Neurospora intermedia TaxID=5142 RepID=A0ABR3D3R4_NEUIN